MVFGGDESTPGEVAAINDPMVHVAFKGFAFVKEGVSVYVRLHLHTNPHGRSTVWHSYEVYAQDTTGAVSFWQGWMPFGTVVEGGGALAGNALATAGVTHFITGASTFGQPEMWYAGNKYSVPWTWDFVVTVNDPTTLYNAGEDANPHDMNAWETTGQYGRNRTLHHAMYYGSDSDRYPFRDTPRGWFCADAYGSITSTGSQTCDADSLPLYVAPTMPALESVQPVSRSYACPACVMPQ